MDSSDIPHESKPKMPVQRGARACSTCRAAKMKCVSADGDAQCQRCRRTNVECIFEKHRRGRKPGSKLSEASKMLRKLEKGLNNAKSKAAVSTDEPHYSYPQRSGDQPPYSSTSSHFSSSDLPPLNSPPYSLNAHPSSATQPMEYDQEDDDNDGPDGSLFPAKMISKESQRHEYFRTVLNTSETAGHNAAAHGPDSPGSMNSLTKLTNSILGPEVDPISSALINEADAKVLFDLFYLRLNPFINLFDPALHTCAYVRAKSPYLFTVIIMASSKFFKSEIFKQCQRMANELAIRAFAEGTRSVEIIQAFACMTYWKDPDDTRTWSWIGYACRMAVDLGLNHSAMRTSNESPLQHLERRNRERTYLVLFVHDRSLATQTGKNWMLLDDEFMQKSDKWHDSGVAALRPEDVIITAFVQLRRIAAETTDMFHNSWKSRSSDMNNQIDVNHEAILRNTNVKLGTWTETWEHEMKRAGAESFHFSFMSMFKSYVKLFLNSFGIMNTLTYPPASSSEAPSLTALSACCTSAMDVLKIVSKDFPSLAMLRYGQDTITVMSAYSAVFLLRLLRNPTTLPLLHNGTPAEIKALIARTADAYHEAAQLSPPWSISSSSATFHSRFLRLLLENDSVLSRREKRYDASQGQNGVIPDLQVQTVSPTSSQGHSPVYATSTPTHQGYFANSPATAQPSGQEYHNNMTMPRNGNMMGPNYAQGAMPTAPPQANEHDMIYWRATFTELGFGDAQNQYNGQPYGNEHQQHPHPQHVAQYGRSQMYQQHNMSQGGVAYQQPPVGQQQQVAAYIR